MTEQTKKGWRDVLKIHPACALFPPMGPDELRALGADIKQNGLQSPIITQDGVIIDGRNRLDAMELVGMTVIENGTRRLSDEVPWEILDDEVDPFAYVISANIHRRHLTTAQKGELIEALLKVRPERSDRATAKIAQVSDKTVGAVREKLEGRAEIPHVERRDDTIGRSQPAHKQPLSEVNRAIAEATAELIEQARGAATAMAIAISDKSGPFPISSQQPATDNDNLLIGRTLELFASRDEPSPPIDRVAIAKAAIGALSFDEVTELFSDWATAPQQANDSDDSVDKYSWPCIPKNLKEVSLNKEQDKIIKMLFKHFMDRRSQRILILTLEGVWTWLEGAASKN
jgi:hypothetical protein